MTILKEIIDKISTFIPYLVFSNKIPIYILPAIVVFPIVFEWISKKFTDWWFTSYTYEIISENEKSDRNMFYYYITFLLNKHNLMENVKYVTINDYNTNRSIKISDAKSISDIYENNPILIPSNHSKIIFHHNEINVEIYAGSYTKHKDKTIRYYQVTAKKYSQIDAFMKYLKHEMQIGYIHSVIDVVFYKYFYYSVKDSKWVSNEINVNKTFKNIFLEQTMKSFVIHNVDNFLTKKKQYDKFGIPHKLGFLFHGKPGNGKSSLAYAIAKTHSKNIYKVNLSVDKSNFINQISTIREGSVVLFEDIDTCNTSHDRNKIEESSKEKNENLNKLELGDILEVLDGYCYLKDCIIIMTTNHIDKLDSALIRSGRVDHKFEFTNASNEQITEIIRFFFKKKCAIKTTKDISVSELINTIILPHIDDYDYVIRYLTS